MAGSSAFPLDQSSHLATEQLQNLTMPCIDFMMTKQVAFMAGSELDAGLYGEWKNGW